MLRPRQAAANAGAATADTTQRRKRRERIDSEIAGVTCGEEAGIDE
jgi:hypothetical protein